VTARTPNPQHAPALALLALVTEHPGLRATWCVAEDGTLSGDLSVDAGGREVMARFVGVLGGEPLESTYSMPSDPGDLWWSSWLWTTWRDAQVSVNVSCPAALASTTGAATALPAAWKAAA
jgi:hypothetical protein